MHTKPRPLPSQLLGDLETSQIELELLGAEQFLLETQSTRGLGHVQVALGVWLSLVRRATMARGRPGDHAAAAEFGCWVLERGVAHGA